jgi:hypothetical protein
VRAASNADAEERLRTVIQSLFEAPERHAGRVQALCGDLTSPDLGLSEPERTRVAEEVGEIIHGAASVAFDLALAESRAINVEGPRQVLVPITIVRPSIVAGERGTGWTASFNVIYGPLRAFDAGTLRVIPGRRAAVVDIVTVDHVADAIIALTASPAATGGTFHVVGGQHATTVGELIRLAAGRFQRPPPRLLPPRPYRRVLHPMALRRADTPTRRRLERTEAYFPYFSLDLRFDDRDARELLDPLGICATPVTDYFDALIDFAQAARWGRAPIGRAQATTLARPRRSAQVLTARSHPPRTS